MGSVCNPEKGDQDTVDPISNDRYIMDSSSEESDSSEHESVDNKDDEPVYNTKEITERIRECFQSAVIKGNDSLLALLAEENPELNLFDMKFPLGDTCLHMSVKGKKLRMSKFLIENGAEINESNAKTGDTALHHACRNRDIMHVKLLMENEADPMICNRNEESSLTISSGFNDDDILHIMQPNYKEILNAQAIEENVLDVEAETFEGFHNAASDVLADSKKAVMNVAALDALDDYMFDSSDEYGYGSGMAGSEGDIDEILEIQKMTSIQARNILNGDLSTEINEHKSEIEELKLDEEEKRHFEAIRIANTNPFSQLVNTKKALHTIKNIAAKKSKLPHLNAWMQKKKSSPPYTWQKRWVIVSEKHMLWSDTQKQIEDASNILERKKFTGSLPLTMIEEVVAKKSKAKRKFIVKVKQQKNKQKCKEYVWRAASEEDRDYWIRGIRLHQKHVRYMLNYLGTKE